MLMVSSNFHRLIQLAHINKRPILLLNIGPTRADSLEITKLEVPCGEALRQVTKHLWFIQSLQLPVESNCFAAQPLMEKAPSSSPS
jgi:hypothetical protein